MTLNELKIDKTWTLFLDRDGVLNLHYPNDYVKKWDEFFFLEGALDAMHTLSSLFRRILIVTNQQGVGKALMTKEDLDLIHEEMMKEIRKHGGRVHAIYAATELVKNDLQKMRKPGSGMAKRAKKDFPEINFSKSILVGDSLTDIQFGKASGMVTVFIGDPMRLMPHDRDLVDIHCDSLQEFANALKH